MNKIYFLIFILSLTGCASNYKTYKEHSYILYQSDMPKYFMNDTLNLYIEIPHSIWNQDFNIGLDYLSLLQQRVLKLSKTNKTQDILLYTDKKCMIVLKKTNVNIEEFRAFSASETTIYKDLPISDGDIFRKTIIDKKTHALIYVDLIPRSGIYPLEYIMILSYQTPDIISNKRDAPIDATNPNDIIFFDKWYKNTLAANRKNSINTKIRPDILMKNPGEILGCLFDAISIKNYNAAKEGDFYSPNYRNPAESGMFKQLLATYYAFANQTHHSDSLWTLLTNNTVNQEFAKKEIDDSFRKKVLQESRIIMFNEAHNVPNHRYFVGMMLQDLYDHGFRYLGLEAFYSDSLFNIYGYPTMNNGFYIREPTYANLIRQAKKIGFTIFGYDAMGPDRELKQAENIKKILFETNDKIAILAGYSHIYPERMAGKFYNITGILPTTIDQTSAYLQHLDNKVRSDKIYLIDSAEFKKPNKVSFFLWNDLNINSNIFSVNKSEYCTINVPHEIIYDTKMIYIYYKHELERYESDGGGVPIPTCVKILENNVTETFLLGKGKYIVCFVDNFNGILDRQEIQL